MAASTYRPAKNLKAGNLIENRSRRTLIVESVEPDPDDKTKVIVHLANHPDPLRVPREYLVKVISVREKS